MGDRIRVVYDPADPGLGVRAADFGGNGPLVVIFGASSVGFVVFAVWTVVRRTPRAG